MNSIIKFPCLVKPTDSPAFVSYFRKKLFKVYNMEELEDAIKKGSGCQFGCGNSKDYSRF